MELTNNLSSTTGKTCISCNLYKPLDEFYTRTMRDGRITHRNTCKKCVSARTRANQLANAEKRREWRRDYYIKTRAAAQDSQRQRRRSWTPEQKQKAAADKRKYWQAKVDKWLAENGEPPFCKCGCGGRVKFHYRTAEPNEYINGHGAKVLGKEIAARRYNDVERIPSKKVSAVLQKLRAEKGLTMPEFADLAGVSESTMKNLLYAETIHGVKKSLVEDVLRRAAGMPMKPSETQLKKMAESQYVWLPGGQAYWRNGAPTEARRS